MLRDTTQEEIHDHIVDNIEGGVLAEAPTGIGKSYILAHAAATLYAQTGRPVIISTANNALARELSDVLVRLSGEAEAPEGFAHNLVIGKSNYIDPVRLSEAMFSAEIYRYTDKRALMQWLGEHKDEAALFFEDFISDIGLYDIASAPVVKDLITFTQKPENMPTFGDAPITVTNSYYLLYRTGIARNIDMAEYDLLIDEVHGLASVAQNIFEYSFSPYRLASSAKAILNLLTGEHSDAFRGSKALAGNLKTLVKLSEKLSRNAIRGQEGLVGEYIVSGELWRDAKNAIEEYAANDAHKNILRQIHGIPGDHPAAALLKPFASEHKELEGIMRGIGMQKPNMSLYLSPSRGYATFKSSHSAPSVALFYNLWEKASRWAGLSATLKTDTGESLKNSAYMLSKLGVSKMEHYKKSIAAWPRPFDPNNCAIRMPEPHFAPPASVYDKDKKEEVEKWAAFVADYIFRRHNGLNSLVICGGYAEVDIIADRLEAVCAGTVVHRASRNESAAQTLARFRQEGGILVGTKNYNTGITLPGSQLERLFLLRLPYPDFEDKHWIEMRIHNNALFWHRYTQEMLIGFRQALGRLARTPDDKGEIHILDSRIYNDEGKAKIPSLKSKLWRLASEYGVVLNDHGGKKAKGKKVESRPVLDEVEAAFGWD